MPNKQNDNLFIYLISMPFYIINQLGEDHVLIIRNMIYILPQKNWADIEIIYIHGHGCILKSSKNQRGILIQIVPLNFMYMASDDWQSLNDRSIIRIVIFDHFGCWR